MKGEKQFTPRLHSIHIEPAKGGVVTDVAMKRNRGGQGGGGDYDMEHTRTIHTTKESLQAHLGECLSGCFAEGEAEKEPEK